MNKLILHILGILALFLPFGAFAEHPGVVDPTPVANLSSHMYLFPTTDVIGKSTLYIMSEAEGTVKFQIFDSDIQPFHEVVVPIPTYTQESYDEYAVPDFEISTEEEIMVDPSLNIPNNLLEEHALAYGTPESHGGKTWYVRSWHDEYRFGHRFPKAYAVIKNGGLYRCYRIYTDVGIYTGEYIKSEQSVSTGQVSPRIKCYYHIGIGGVTSENKNYLSKRFFNQDDKFEYFIENFSYIERVKSYTDYRKVYKGYYCTGFSLMNEEGEILATFNLKDPGPYSSVGYLYLLDLGDKKYFVQRDTRYDGGGNGEEFYEFYKVNQSSSGVQMVKVANIPVSISPKIAQRSTPIEVTVPENFGNSTIVNVVSMTGNTVYQRRMSADTNTLKIETDGFAPGVYVVNVSNGSTTQENCKIVIR